MSELFAADLPRRSGQHQEPHAGSGHLDRLQPVNRRQKTEANLGRQYAKLAGVEIQITDTARHFIMWDDRWMFVNWTAFWASPNGAVR